MSSDCGSVCYFPSTHEAEEVGSEFHVSLGNIVRLSPQNPETSQTVKSALDFNHPPNTSKHEFLVIVLLLKYF